MDGSRGSRRRRSRSLSIANLLQHPLAGMLDAAHLLVARISDPLPARKGCRLHSSAAGSNFGANLLQDRPVGVRKSPGGLTVLQIGSVAIPDLLLRSLDHGFRMRCLDLNQDLRRACFSLCAGGVLA